MSDNAPPPVRLRESVLAIPAYKQGAAPTKPGYKLSSNENPFDPLPGVLEAIRGRTDVNRYAAAAMPDLRAQLAAGYGVRPDHVHLGAGSVAILYQLIQAAAGPGEEYVHAWPSFEAYPTLGIASGARAVPVPLNERAEHDLDAMADAVTERTRAVLLCTPNNPTGTAIRRADFERFMARVPGDVLVVLDEAYTEFVTDADAVRGADVLADHPNLVLLRTFSKAYGLAGLRVGYGIGDPAILSAAASVAIPLSITGIAESAALASLAPGAREENGRRIAEIARRRDALAAELRGLGLDIPDAQGNFLWVWQNGDGRSGGVDDGLALGAAFAEEGTLVRPFPGDGVRISIGEAESLPVVVEVLSRYVAGGA